MSIMRCNTHGMTWDSDKHDECPWCANDIGHRMAKWNCTAEIRHPTVLEIKSNSDATDLVRLLKDQTQSQAVFDRCRKFLGDE
jgi:uncharacterized protein YfcZ (UPF0381/DUF406 family)